jgi:hypothetical protein
MMPGPPSPPQAAQRPSLRWDAAQRACRDDDLATLTFLVAQGGLFENLPVLREACLSGEWGRGTSPRSQKFSTTDSIRLSNLLQTATTRGHVDIIRYLLETFPAKDLHVLEWETVVNALATGRVEVLEPFLVVDPGLVNMADVQKFGTCFTVLFDLVLEKEKHLPVVKLLCEHDVDISTLPNVFYDCARCSTSGVLAYFESQTSRPLSKETLLCIACNHGNDDIAQNIFR